MKKSKRFPIRFVFCFLTSLLFTISSYTQNRGIYFSTRLLVQSDFQKADFQETSFPYTYKEHSATTINFGIDLLTEKELLARVKAHIGAGYYRNKFTFKRFYDHRLLNIGTDSILIGTGTRNYTFHLVRCPVGISYQLTKINKYLLNLELEDIVNFSFQQVYNGSKPFPDANNKLSKFQYFGNSILVNLNIVKKNSQNSFLQFGPYIRLFNSYKRKDPILFDYTDKNYSRGSDAIGLLIKYSFALKE